MCGIEPGDMLYRATLGIDGVDHAAASSYAMNEYGRITQPHGLGWAANRGVARLWGKCEIVGQPAQGTRRDLVQPVIGLRSVMIFTVEDDERSVRRPAPRANHPV